MKKIAIDFSKISDDNMTKVFDIFAEEFGKEFSDMTKVDHSFTMVMESEDLPEEIYHRSVHGRCH